MQYKMNTAKSINKIPGSEGIPVWQRNYYERMIRNDGEYSRIHYDWNNFGRLTHSIREIKAADVPGGVAPDDEVSDGVKYLHGNLLRR